MYDNDTQLSENGGASNTQSLEDQQTVRHVMKLFKKAKKYRARYDRNWLHYYKMFRGDQWDGIKMPRYRQKEIINMIWQAVQSNMPLQTDVRPRLSFIPQDPSDQPFAEILNKVSEHDWESQNWLEQLSCLILDGYIYGTGISFQGYDSDAKMGEGAATYKSEDPFYIYPDPEATDVNCKKSEFIIKAEPVETERLKRAFPEFEDEIKSDIRDVIKSSKTALNDFKIRTQATDREMPDITWTEGQEKDRGMTLVITAYMKPQDTEEVDEETEELEDDGSPKVKTIVRKKFPYGRKVVIACGLKLMETELPFQHGQFPFERYQNYILPREFYGVSEVEQLESPQRIFNKLINASLEILNLMGNPIWVVDSSSGVDPHKLVNKTGLVVEKEPNSEVRREAGTQLSGTALSFIDRMESWFNNIAGTQDVTRGQTPGSVTAASAIEQLQDAAKTRIRQKQRNLDVYLRKVGQQYVDIILEKYSAPRIVRVTNNEDDAQYFKLSVDKDPDGKVNAIVQHYNQREDGTIVPDNELKQMYIAGRFDVRVNTGSSLPFAVADKEQKVLALYDRQILDAEEVLDALEYPNREEILQRLKEREEAAMMAAQQEA